MNPTGPYRQLGRRTLEQACHQLCGVESTLGTLGGERLGALLRQRFVRRLALEIVTDAVLVAKAEGVRLDYDHTRGLALRGTAIDGAGAAA